MTAPLDLFPAPGPIDESIGRHPAGFISRGLETTRARARRLRLRRLIPISVSEAVALGLLDCDETWCEWVRVNPRYL